MDALAGHGRDEGDGDEDTSRDIPRTRRCVAALQIRTQYWVTRHLPVNDVI